MIAHLKTYATPELAKKLESVTTISDDEYAWSLNDTKGATAAAAR